MAVTEENMSTGPDPMFMGFGFMIVMMIVGMRHGGSLAPTLFEDTGFVWPWAQG